MIVLDASVALELLLRTPRGEALAGRLLSEEETLHAPHLLDVEVVQVLRRLAGRGELGADRAAEALADLRDLPLERYTHELLVSRAWELRTNLTIYDGVYVALAELLEAPLVTRDRRLAAAPGVHTAVEVV